MNKISLQPAFSLTCLFSALLLIFSLLPAQAQTPQWKWAKRAGTGGNETGAQIVCDPSGNIFSWGTFSSNITFGSITLTPAASSGYYVVKHDANGNALWAKKLPALINSIKSASIDAQGNIYMTGAFGGTLTMGAFTITNPTPQPRPFILKYDPNGNLVWLKKKATNNFSALTYLYGLTKWDDTHFIARGYSVKDTIDGHFISSSVGTAWFAMMDTAGNYSAFTTLGKVSLGGLVIDSQFNIYVSGDYQVHDSLDLGTWNPDTSSSGGYVQTFIARFDSNRNYIWSKTTFTQSQYGPGFGYAFNGGLTVDPQDNVYALSRYQGDSLALDATHGHFFPLDPFGQPTNAHILAKYGSDGTILWDSIFKITDPFKTTFSAICSDKTGAVYCAGNFSGRLSFNGTSIWATGTNTLFVTKFDADGRSQWLQHTTLDAKCNAAGISEDGKGNLFLTGGFTQGNAAFGSTTLMMAAASGSIYNGDLFIARLGDCSAPVAPVLSPGTLQHLCNNESLTISSSPADQYIWSNGDTTSAIHVNTAGMYSVFGADSLGCYARSADVQVTTGSANSSVSVSGNTLTAVETGATAYQWFDCGNSLLSIAGAGAQSFTPAADGSYALMITENNCIDTSACFPVTMVSVQDHNHEATLMQLFPNPNNGAFTIGLSNNQQAGQLVIIDVLGRELIRQDINAGTHQCSFSDLPSGVYQLVFKIDGKQQSAQKMIIQK